MLIFLLVGGIFGAVGYFAILRPEMEVDRAFIEGRCEILGKQLIEEEKRSKSSRKSGSSRSRKHYRPEFHIRYKVQGTALEARTWRIVQSSSTSESGEQQVLDRFEVGKTYPCWYDPADPSRVVVEKGISTGGIILVALGGLFALIGAGGIVLAPLRAARAIVN
jgi:hypothetical protein